MEDYSSIWIENESLFYWKLIIINNKNLFKKNYRNIW